MKSSPLRDATKGAQHGLGHFSTVDDRWDIVCCTAHSDSFNIKKKSTPPEFAAIAFVLQSQKKTARSMRLKEMILLLLRCLWVLCLALAFLQPVLEENRELEQNRQEPKIIILVMDLSASMQATVAGASRFEAAVTKATEEISNSESEVQWGLIGCNRGLTATQIAPTFDRDKMFQALSTLKVSSMSARLPACIDAAQGLLAGKEEPVVRKIWVLSDMAKHAFTGAVAPAVGKVQIHFEKLMRRRFRTGLSTVYH